MDRLTLIGLAAGRVLSFLMRAVGLVAAVDLLLIHPERATAPDLVLTGVLLMGGEKVKELVLAAMDRLLDPAPHHSLEQEERRPK